MDPLFVTDLDELKANLRLTNVDSETDVDANTLIQRAIRKVRINFRRRLSQTRIETIQGYTQDASPVDPDEDTEYIRELAEMTEIDWVHLELTYILPMLFTDASASGQEVFNEEAPFRRAELDELDSLRRRLKEQIEAAIDILAGDDDLDESPECRAHIIGPDKKRYVGRAGRRQSRR
jgi:hypothetical protein